MSWICEQRTNITSKGNYLFLSGWEDNEDRAPVNALFKPFDGGMITGKHFFEFRFKNCRNGAFVGITDEEHFEPGYLLKAFLYGEHLSNGSKVLIADFGDRIVDNDKVSILLELENKWIKLYVFHNDKPLGLAFYVKHISGKPLFPVVQMYNSAEVWIQKRHSLPIQLERSLACYSGMEGTWKIERCEQDGMLTPDFRYTWQKFPLKITSDASMKQNVDTYYLVYKIRNTLFATLQNINGKWYMSSGLSTSTAFNGEITDAESFLHQFLDNFDRFEIIGQTLIFYANNKQKMIFKRRDANILQAITINPLK